MAAIRSITNSFLNLKHIKSKFSYNVRLFSNSNVTKVHADPVKMPSLSPTMDDGAIVKWYKKEGELIEAGEIICDIQTDKAVVSFETDDDIILAKILKEEGSSGIKIGDLIALSVSPSDVGEYKNVKVPDDNITDESQPTEPTPAAASTNYVNHVSGYGPAVRTLLEVYNIKASEVAGSGPGSRLIKGDLLKFIEGKNLTPAAITSSSSSSVAPVPVKSPPKPAETIKADKAPKKSSTAASVLVPEPVYEDIELTSMRKAIAKRLTLSKTSIPHCYASVECEMTKVIELRTQLKEEHNTKVSVNDIIIKAAAVALRAVPEVNASYDVTTATVTPHDEIDIATAVATPNGLITPIIRDSLSLGLSDISSRVKHLASKAREGKLQPDEFEGGTFTVSNLGMFGISEFTAIINPPQSSILSVGKNEPQLKMVDGKVESVQVLTCALSADARVVDDFIAAKFLEQFKKAMETPMFLMTGLPRI